MKLSIYENHFICYIYFETKLLLKFAVKGVLYGII